LERHYHENLEKYIKKREQGKRYVLIEWVPFIKETFFRTKFFALMKSGRTSPFYPYDYILRKIPKKMTESKLEINSKESDYFIPAD